MLLIVITVLFVLTEKTNGGYIYPRPNISFKLPKIESNLEEDIQQKSINQLLPKPITESVSYERVLYSVPFQNCHQLNQHNSLISDHIQASKVIGDFTVNSVTNQQNNLHINEASPYENPAISIPPLQLIAPLKNQQSNLAVNTGEHIKIPADSIPIIQNNDFVSSVNISAIPAVTVLQPIKELSHLEVNPEQHFDINANSVSNIDLHASPKYHSSLEYDHIPHLNIPTTNVPTSENLQNDPALITQTRIIQQDNNNDLNSPINSQNVVYPNVMKHIYFHVPPPEIEEPSKRTVVPKTKNVNIIFIKVPHQQRKYIGQSQIDAINQVLPIEEKTIIYVLSKAPTSEQVYLPKPVTPHEIFFVKYNGSADSAVTQINDNLEENRKSLNE